MPKNLDSSPVAASPSGPPVAQQGAAMVRGILALVMVALAAWAWWGSSSKAPKAPSVAYTLLDGSVRNTEALKGKVVLVNFWATSCSTCVREMPHIIDTHVKFKDRGFDTLAVAMSYDPPAYVANFANTRKLPFGVAIDNTGGIAKSFGEVQLTPTTFLIDRDGTIVKRYVGEPDFAALHQLIESLLAKT